MKKDFNLGTHNSMSYLPPLKWYMRPFAFIARCQTLDYKEQLKRGCTMIDLRVAIRNNKPYFAHGSMLYKEDVIKVLDYINSIGKPIYIRLIHETSMINKEGNPSLFIELCKEWELKYKNLMFFEGRRKSDWKQLYKFKTVAPSVEQKVSSMTGTILDDWCPWLYARFMNKKNLKKGTNKDYLLLDFIEYS